MQVIDFIKFIIDLTQTIFIGLWVGFAIILQSFILLAIWISPIIVCAYIGYMMVEMVH